MTDPTELLDGHEWQQCSRYDKLDFYCSECKIHIPVTAADTQAGIRLFCPQCDRTMEYNFEWREEREQS
ncbi:hypothetical protein DVK02_14910 [Halobellus sp. Atlit-31R]|nr:hypothetical protein DVK02_14910 [Halobellus sp. Atlit-31R]